MEKIVFYINFFDFGKFFIRNKKNIKNIEKNKKLNFKKISKIKNR